MYTKPNRSDTAIATAPHSLCEYEDSILAEIQIKQ